MSFENINFKNAPDFKFKEIVCENSECLSSSYQFDCYKDKNGEIILISPYFNLQDLNINNYHISLINLKNNQVLRTLNGHTDRIITLRYFQDPNTKNNYLISADRKCNVIVWDLSHNCDKIFERNIYFESFIYSTLIIFESNKKYIALTSVSSENITKIIDIEDKNKIIKIKDSKNLYVYHLTYWYNHKRKQHNIIQCGKCKILITEFPNNQTYDTIFTTDKYPYNMGGTVYKNKEREFLATSSSYGLIQIYELELKIIMLKIKLEDVHLYSFIKWNDNYLLILDTSNKKIIVFDITDNAFKVKNEILCQEMYYDRFIQKIVHPKYGESILSIGIDYKIKLFINKNNNN